MKLIQLIAVLALAGLFGSCNTAIGFGRDLKILGDGMENSANKAGGSGGSGDSSGGAPVY